MTLPPALTRVLRLLEKPIDLAWVAYFRVAFGGILLWEVYRYVSKGRVESYYRPTDFHFKYYAFEWVEPLSPHGMQSLFLALGLLSLFMILGFLYRASVALLFVGFSYVFLLEQAQYLNHFYLICLLIFVMFWLPAHRLWSLDAWFRPALRSDVAPAWTLWALRAQIGIPYVYAAIAKMNDDWLRAEPVRGWIAKRADLVGAWVLEPWAPYFVAWGGLLFDLLVVPGLLYRRTRYLFLAAGLFFHLTNSQLFKIGVFPWMSIAALFLFFPPDVPRRLLRRLPWLGPRIAPPPEDVAPPRPGKKKRRKAAPIAPSPVSRSERVARWVMGVHVVLQVLIPLRHHLYPGDVQWTQEGHRFSWRMKLRSNDGRCYFGVDDPQTGQKYGHYPRQLVSKRSASKLSGRPDMVLQLAHHIARLHQKEYGTWPQVRAMCLNSSNGRPPALLIDPDVDLAAQTRSIWPATWILPLTEPLPSYEDRVRRARIMGERALARAAAEQTASENAAEGEGGAPEDRGE